MATRGPVNGSGGPTTKAYKLSYRVGIRLKNIPRDLQAAILNHYFAS